MVNTFYFPPLTLNTISHDSTFLVKTFQFPPSLFFFYIGEMTVCVIFVKHSDINVHCTFWLTNSLVLICTLSISNSTKTQSLCSRCPVTEWRVWRGLMSPSETVADRLTEWMMAFHEEEWQFYRPAAPKHSSDLSALDCLRVCMQAVDVSSSIYWLRPIHFFLK